MSGIPARPKSSPFPQLFQSSGENFVGEGMEAEDFVGPGGVQEDSLVVEGTPPTYHAPLPIPQRITEPTGG